MRYIKYDNGTSKLLDKFKEIIFGECGNLIEKTLRIKFAKRITNQSYIGRIFISTRLSDKKLSIQWYQTTPTSEITPPLK